MKILKTFADMKNNKDRFAAIGTYKNCLLKLGERLTPSDRVDLEHSIANSYLQQLNEHS